MDEPETFDEPPPPPSFSSSSFQTLGAPTPPPTSDVTSLPDGAAFTKASGPPCTPKVPPMALPALALGNTLGMLAGLRGLPGLGAPARPAPGRPPTPDLATIQQAIGILGGMIAGRGAGLRPGMPLRPGLVPGAQLMLPGLQATEGPIHPKVAELCDYYKCDEKLTRLLDQQIKLRNHTSDGDIEHLWEVLHGARSPPGLLMIKIREMQEGTFIGRPQADKELEEMSTTFKLDSQAKIKLTEVLVKCSKDMQGDLRKLRKHLECSNKPSALVMLMLGKIRRGEDIGECTHAPAPGSFAWTKEVRAAEERGRKDRSRPNDRGRRQDRDKDRFRYRERSRDREADRPRDRRDRERRDRRRSYSRSVRRSRSRRRETRDDSPRKSRSARSKRKRSQSR